MTLLAQLSEGQRRWEVVQYDATSTMSMRIPAAWTIARGDQCDGGMYDVNAENDDRMV